ncbi:Isoquinoline 1-oxidoreductase subunit [Bradyrhizobium sp. 192]|uniref:Isoquinoline 1-oxidoreductase subunit n=1 Tax=Bradyrhizobium sp. 192 TaxID=2782660 RepID=UPI001FFE94FF|nr:Isoquinoline 1-oxidoreductase subunit [Bradyrhizobium sp. 192]
MIAFVAAMAGSRPSGADPSSASSTLRNAGEFSSISNQADRSRALFEEIGKVLTNPRCMNCHPAGDHPLQGDDSHEHVPPIWRAETGHYEVSCSGCHSGKNFSLHEAATYRSIPGHPRWGFAPLSMAWEGKSLGDICRQLKDVQLNGGRDLAALQEHIAKDDLVAWGWNPGEGRKPAPGSQQVAGELVQAWIDSGAECPR